MKSRRLNFDFSGVTTYWAENREFAQIYNGASIVPAYLEPYLCRIITMAKPHLPDHMHEEVDVFVRQETQHFKNHRAFNKAVSTDNPDIRPIELAMAKDYDDFARNRSLQFNLAYCEGFEASSAIPMDIFFNDFQPYWRGSHPKVESFWKWHFAEEHEHRSTVYKIYHALYGNGPKAWAYRVYGLFYSMKHIMGYTNRLSDILLAVDQANMTPEEKTASNARVKSVRDAMKKNGMRHLLAICSPFYDPEGRSAPPEIPHILNLQSVPPRIIGGVSAMPG